MTCDANTEIDMKMMNESSVLLRLSASTGNISFLSRHTIELKIKLYMIKGVKIKWVSNLRY